MKLQDQVCTLEQAKRLKVLRVSQASIFNWWIHPLTGETGIHYLNMAYNVASAFTVAELGVMLPAGYDTMLCTGEGWRGYNMDGDDFLNDPIATEAKCRGAMLIHLLETNAITAEEVNKRLEA